MERARKLGISFQYKRGRGVVRIHRSTLAALGYPEFYRFLYYREKRRFAIESCAIDDAGSHIFRGIEEKSTHSYSQNSFPMIAMIFDQCGWNKGLSYTVSGIDLFDGKMVCFDLHEAEAVREAEE